MKFKLETTAPVKEEDLLFLYSILLQSSTFDFYNGSRRIMIVGGMNLARVRFALWLLGVYTVKLSRWWDW